MSLVVKINGSTLADKHILRDKITGFPSSAWYGEPMIAGLTLDDPEGELDIQGWSVFTVDETDCTDNERIFTGWITGKVISRGPYKSGDARQWEVDIIDQNACLGFQIFRANSAKRPAETDLARVDFILASAPMHYTPVAAGTLTNLTDNPANLQEADHTRQYPIEALTSTAGRSGKWMYVFWNDDTDQLELFYDKPSAFPASSIQISNVIADVDNDVIFYPFIDARMKRSPENVYTGELLDYVGGAVFVERQATIDALSPTPLSPDEWRRDFHRSSDQIGRAETATSLGLQDLDNFATEEDTITVTLRLPSTHVNFVEAGQVIPAKFTHLPGYELGPDMRVIRRNVIPSPPVEDVGPQYDVTLELTNKVKIRDIDGGPPGVFPKQPCLPQLIQFAEGRVSNSTADATWPAAPTPGDLLVMWIVTRSGEIEPNGWTALDTGWSDDPSATKSIECRMFYKLASIGETLTPTYTDLGVTNQYVCMAEFSGVDTLDDFSHFDDTTTQTAPASMFWATDTVTPTADRPCLFIGGVMPSLNVNDNPFNPLDTTIGGTTIAISGKSTTTGTGVGGTDAKSWFGYKVGTGSSSPVPELFSLENSPTAGISRGHVGLIAAFTGDPCENACPQAGQWVRGEFVANGDGTTTVFNTECPYADGSLNVRVDGVPLLIGVTESDPATGEFTLDFAPKDSQGDAPAEQVFVSYQGR